MGRGGRDVFAVSGVGVAVLAAVVVAVVVLALAAGPLRAQGASGGYQKQESPLTTPWTEEVGPENALPEYPRPQMVRDEWRNLNGVWQFEGAEEGDEPPFGRDPGERILVPYPVESALSGIERHEDRMFYRRTFEVPKKWNIGKSERLVVNFGAVDYQTTVWVNGKRVGDHKGGYDDFSLDVTDALKKRASRRWSCGS